MLFILTKNPVTLQYNRPIKIYKKPTVDKYNMIQPRLKERYCTGVGLSSTEHCHGTALEFKDLNTVHNGMPTPFLKLVCRLQITRRTYTIDLGSRPDFPAAQIGAPDNRSI